MESSLKAHIVDLEADRDRWMYLALERLKDWDTMRVERNELKARLEVLENEEVNFFIMNSHSTNQRKRFEVWRESRFPFHKLRYQYIEWLFEAYQAGARWTYRELHKIDKKKCDSPVAMGHPGPSETEQILKDYIDRKQKK